MRNLRWVREFYRGNLGFVASCVWESEHPWSPERVAKLALRHGLGPEVFGVDFPPELKGVFVNDFGPYGNLEEPGVAIDHECGCGCGQ